MVTVKKVNSNINDFTKVVKHIRQVLACLCLGLLVGLPIEVFADTCDNVTSGGEIGTTEVSCGPFDPPLIQSLSMPSGGSGNIEFLWLKTTDPTLPRSEWDVISGWDSPTYDPGFITETTYFLRCSRRSNCNNYDGESNIIPIVINGIDIQCGPGSSEINVSGNASHESNIGVDSPGKATGTIDGDGAQLYDDGDVLVLDLNQALAPGQKYTLSWKYRSYTSSYNGPAKVEVYESADGTNFSYNTTLTTNVKLFYVAQTITAATTTRYVKLVNPNQTPDFDVDAIAFCNSTCQSDQPQTCKLDNYGEPGSGDSERLLWLNFNTGVERYAVDANGVSFVENPDGTATITGIAENITDPTFKWQINARLINKRTWAEWSQLGRDFKANNNVNADHTTWSYYELDNTQSTLTGLGGNSGLNLILSHAPSDYKYAFQVGYGANVMDGDYGLSGWFNMSGDLTANGDFNGDLENCNDTDVCENLTDGGDIESDEAICGNGYDPAKIHNTNLPTGGSGDIEYLWLKSTTTGTPPNDIFNDNNWEIINGANDPYYDPGPINETTYYIRYARRANCEDYLPSNVVTKAINDIPEISNVAKEHVSCNGGSDGFIDLTVSNGTPPYQFNWSNAAGNLEDIDNLVAGTYNVTLTDANGCYATKTITIDEPLAIDLTAFNSDIFCFGETANVDLSVEGGTLPYSYTWSNGATTANVDGLEAGGYSVTVTDANGCVESTQFVINGPQSALSCTPSSTNVSCFDGTNGTATISAEGGTAPYTYLWSNGMTQASIQNIAAGAYHVTVTDANGCVCFNQLAVLQPNAALSLSTNQVDVACNGGTNGSIDLIVEGGTAPYSFNWNNGATTEDLDGLTAGTYTVTVLDANDCEANINATISESGGLEVQATVVDLNCFGEANGAISIDVNGGQAPYSFSWTNGATTASIQNLTSGDYGITVTDSNGCVKSFDTSVSSPNALELNAEVQNILCNSAQNGAIDLTVSGGTAPYSFDWSNGSDTEDIDGLAANEYQVVVIDANGCTASLVKVIEEEAPIQLNAEVQNILCNGEQNGAIDLTVSGGTAPYSFDWSNGADTEDIDGLVANEYQVVVTDANGCTASLVKVIEEEAPIQLNAEVQNILCNGEQNGAIDLTVSGGTAPYSFDWSNGSDTEDIDGLVANEYQVVVIDANGCTASLVKVIEEEAPIQLNAEVQNILCNGEQNGAIDLTVSGGTAPYSFDWSNGADTEDIDGLVANEYQVVVIDANGCTASLVKVIEEEAPIQLNAEVLNIFCNGEQSGAIDLSVSGGTAPYSFDWSNGADTEDIDGLVANEYQVVVTDANGCTASLIKVVIEANAIEVHLDVQDVLCHGDQNGSIDLTISGGMAPYSFLWSNGADSEDIDGLAAGIYEVTIIDANQCIYTTEGEVNSSEALSLSFDKTNASCAQAEDGSIDLNISGGTAPYAIQWSNGSTSEDLNNLTAGVYTAFVNDQNNCSTEIEVTIETPEALLVDFNTEAPSCNGALDGSIDLSISGGTSPYSVNWSNGSDSEDLFQLGAGVYTATITDANGCSTVLNQIVVNEPAALSATISSTDVSCQNEQNGFITLNVTGGTAEYTHLWNTGNTTANIDGLGAGDYAVTITDANQCSINLFATINQPDAIVLSVATNDASCHDGNEGSIDLTVAGGTAPYSYDWSNGSDMEDLDGLAAGTYIVAVTDANGCVEEISATVNAPAAIDATITIINYISAAGSSTGTLNADATGGTTPYTYLWNNGATTPTIDSLPAGDYVVTVTDANGCTDVADVSLLDAAKIGNRVWDDFNGNGIQDQGEQGVVGVTVKLTGTDPQGNIFTLNTTTNALGEYCFDGLTPGDYSLRFILDNGYVFTKAFQGNDTNIDSDVNPIDGKTGTITLDYGTTNLDIDAGIYVPSKIGDFVWEDTNADGIQDQGENGLNQITVTLTGTTGAGDPVNMTTISGPNPNDPTQDGYYSFEDVAPGNYTISFNVNSGYTPSPSDQTTDDQDSDVNDMNAVTNIDIIGGTTIDHIDAGFFRAAKLGNFVWEDLNRNGIQDDGDTGVTGVVVNLIDLGPDGEIGGNDDVLANVISTSSDGSYCFIDILPGTYAIRFRSNSLPDGYKFTEPDQTDDLLDSDADPTTGYTTKIVLSSGQNNISFDAGIVSICDDLSSGGNISADESACGSYDPEEITETNPATGGSGNISYQWYQTTLANPTVPVDLSEWTIIQGANGINYDPATIDETTHYVRAAKRDGCIDFTVTSNIVTKSISVVDLNVEFDMTNERCAGSLIQFIAYSSATDITVTWFFFDGNSDTTLLLNQTVGEESEFVYNKAGDKLIRVIVEDAATGCSETHEFSITILPITDPNCSVLPFAPAFVSFEASLVQQEYVQLDWRIKEGDEFENFELERSPNGVNFEVFAAVFGQTEETEYDYLDRSPYIGRNFYRVKYIRLDGTQFYSDVVSVIIESNIDANIFPNPTQDYSNINFTNTIRENSLLEVVNSNGQVMESRILPSGTTYTQLDLQGYQPGMYYIYLQTNARRDLIQQILKIDN